MAAAVAMADCSVCAPADRGAAECSGGASGASVVSVSEVAAIVHVQRVRPPPEPGRRASAVHHRRPVVCTQHLVAGAGRGAALSATC